MNKEKYENKPNWLA